MTQQSAENIKPNSTRRFNWLPTVEIEEAPDTQSRRNRLQLTLRYKDLDEHHAEAVKKLARSLPELVNAIRNDDFEHRVQQLIKAYRPADPLADVLLTTYENGLVIKSDLVGQYSMLNAKAILENAKRVGITSPDIVDTWMKEGKMLSINYHGIDLFPAFQFSSGKPLPIIAELLKILRKGDRSSWDIAIWFTSINGWLDGDRPVDALTTEPMLVLDAAEQHVLSDH